MLGAWTELERLLAASMPQLVVALRPGAPEPTIASLESSIGQPLPRDLRAFLALHDGQVGAQEGELIATHRLHSCAEMQRWWKFWASEFGGNYPGAPGRRFVELTSSDGDAFLVELPGGAVFFHVRGEGVYGPVAPSFEAFLEDLAQRLADGRATIEDAGTYDAAIWVDDYNPARVPKRFPALL